MLRKRSINMIESVKTGEVVARKDAHGNFVFSASTEPCDPMGARPDAKEVERDLTRGRLWRWFGRFRNNQSFR